jgi:nucleotide-binding universal stress UspA family protein
MLPIRRIVFPVDFSERCGAAAPQVVAKTKHFNAKLTVLNVIEIPPSWYGGLAAAELEMLVNVEDLKNQRHHELDAYVQTVLGQLPGVETLVEKGDPAGVIIAYARKQQADLIMMPTHGYGPFRRFLLGSVTAKVLHDADCPVWTDVHAGMPFERLGCQSILCAVDLREEGVRVIEWAAGFARSYGAELTLMHAIPAMAGPTAPGEKEFRKYLMETAREYIADLQRKAGTQLRVCIEGGKIAESVCGAALRYAADLVVIGQGSVHETLGRLRTNVYAIVRTSPCPVVRV